MTVALLVEEATLPKESGSVRLLAIITGLFLSARLAMTAEEEAFHRARLRWEWRSRQWVMLTDDHDCMLGWMSWWRVTDAVLATLRTHDLPTLTSHAPAEQALTSGPHLHIATVVIVPGAPPDVFKRLCQMATSFNMDAESVSWHRYPLFGRPRFVLRRDHWQDDVF